MDIMIHILLIIIIGAFFFIYTYSRTYNPMLFIVFISLIGIFFLMYDNVELIDYNGVVKINDTWQNPKTDISNQGWGLLNIESGFIVFYVFMLLMAFTNMVLGDKE